MKKITLFLLTLFLTYPISINATTYRTAYPYTIKYRGQNIRIEAVPYAPRDGSPMFGKTDIYLDNKKLYSIEKYFREDIFPSNNGEIVAIINPYVSRYIIDTSQPDNYDDEVITILKNGKPLLIYKLNQLINVNEIEKSTYEYSFHWVFKHNPYDSWLNRLKSKKTEKNNLFVENNILHIVTATSTIVRINLKDGSRLSDLNLENSLPIRRNFKPLKKIKRFHKTIYPEKFLLPKMNNGNSFDLELSKFLNLKLTNSSASENETISVYIHTFLLNKGGNCEIAYINSGDKLLDNKITKWLKTKKFDIVEIPKNLEKFKFEGFVYLKK